MSVAREREFVHIERMRQQSWHAHEEQWHAHEEQRLVEEHQQQSSWHHEQSCYEQSCLRLRGGYQ